MLNQQLWQISDVKKVRVIQVFFLFLTLWFFFWAHIYEMQFWNKTFVESIQSEILNVSLYSISLVAILVFEVYLRRSRPAATGYSASTILEHPRTEKEILKNEPVKAQKNPTNKIGATFIAIGTLLLISSLLIASTILAFIGLGLTFWGALFLFVRSNKFVRKVVLDASVTASYTTLDRMVTDLNYAGKALYIPPYPKDAYLPEYLGGIKDLVVFISANDSMSIPPIEEIGKKRFMVKNPKGICISPPGSGLVNVFEKELKVDFSKINQESFQDYLSPVIVDVLELATGFELEYETGLIHVTFSTSVYQDLYSKEKNLKSVHYVGCPLASAVACILAKTTGKVVTIAKIDFSMGFKNIEVWYQLVEG